MAHVMSLPDYLPVTVIVPFYGTDVSALLRCVQGLLDQDYPKDRVSVIVVDNNERARLSSSIFGPRCKLFHEPRPGSYAARNRGIAESFGDIIAFTDSDCVPQRSWISAGVKALAKATGPSIVGGPIIIDFHSNIVKTVCELLDSIIHHRQTEYIFEHGFAATANLFVPRAVISNYGQFDARFYSGGDREFGQRLAAAGVRTEMASDAIIMHPARAHFMDLLKKGVRGVGGEKMYVSLRKYSLWMLFKMQIENYWHRQRLISHRAGALGMARYQLIKLRTLLTLIYLARFLEAIRLAFGGKPYRI
jgi:glycosyltransferase involved in cell wall biosynthesis